MDSEDILKKIDSVVGPPEAETPEQREERKRMIERDIRERAIRKAANTAA
jgi:hypothetical protein